MPFGSLYIQLEKWHSTHQIIQHNEAKQLQTKTVNKEPEATQFANKSAAVGGKKGPLHKTIMDTATGTIGQ